jgi:hypothetical protein
VFVFPSDVEHDGLPDRWDFDWVEFESTQEDICGRNGEDECEKSSLCGWCGATKKCIAGDKDGPFLGVKCTSGWFAKGMTPAWVIAVSVVGGLLGVGIVVLAVVLWRRRR